jgi:hypothetical protein
LLVVVVVDVVKWINNWVQDHPPSHQVLKQEKQMKKKLFSKGQIISTKILKHYQQFVIIIFFQVK